MLKIAQQPCSLLRISDGAFVLSQGVRTLLCQEQSVALLDGDTVPRVLVVWGETGWVRALADLAVDDLLERVDALGRVRWVWDVHEMHARGNY